MRSGERRRPFDLGNRSLRAAVPNVLDHRHIEELRRLRGIGDACAQALEGERPRRDAVERDPPLARFAQPGQQVDERGLARPGRPDQRRDACGRNVQVDPAQRVFARAIVAKGDALQSDPFAQAPERPAARMALLRALQDLQTVFQRLDAAHLVRQGVVGARHLRRHRHKANDDQEEDTNLFDGQVEARGAEVEEEQRRRHHDGFGDDGGACAQAGRAREALVLPLRVSSHLGELRRLGGAEPDQPQGLQSLGQEQEQVAVGPHHLPAEAPPAA